MNALIEIEEFRLAFDGFEGRAKVLDDVSLKIEEGETVGLVGETGCGKSVLARSITRLIEIPPARVLSGTVRFEGRDVFALDRAALIRLRGRGMATIFQDPTTFLNPVFSIGWQMSEAIRAHDRAGGSRPRHRRAALMRAAELLAAVHLPDPERVLAQYPHQLSGGMRQRVLIATALAANPRLLIADEPTTALDVTIQLQILRLIAELVAQRRLTLLLISHDLGVVATLCRRIVVMYAGSIVEDAPASMLLARPLHPYTRGLLAAVPDLASSGYRAQAIPGHIPSPLSPPPGCRFHPRCAHALPGCMREKPMLRAVEGRLVACHRAEELAR